MTKNIPPKTLSSTFQNVPQLYCGDEWYRTIFLRGLIPRRKVLDLFLWLAIVFYIAVFFYLCLHKYQNFLYNLEDLSIFNNVLYNTAHGNLFWFSPHGGFSYLGDHLELGLLLLLPIYYFFQSPLTLLFLQTALFALSAWPVYLIAGRMSSRANPALAGGVEGSAAEKDAIDSSTSFVAPDESGAPHSARNDIKKFLPLLIAFLFLLNPFIHNINLEEFHLAPLLLFFFLWTFYFYLKKKYRLFILFFILTLLLREDAALTLGALAIIAAWDNRRQLWFKKKWWLYPLIISLIWFFAAFKIINFFNPDSGYRFLILYQHLDIYHPLTWLPRLLNAKTLSLATGFLLPFIFLPLYRPKYLFLALPAFLQATLLDAGASSTSYYTHHQIFILTALFLSLSGSLNSIADNKKYQKYLFLIIGLLIFSQFYISAFLGPFKFICPSPKKNLASLENTEENNKMLSLIPTEADISGPYRFMPRLSSREKAYQNKLTFLGKKHLAEGDFILPPDTEYLLIDSTDMIEYYLHFQNRSRYSQLYWGGAERMRQTIARQNFQPIALTDSLMLFKKDAAARPLPYQMIETLPADLKGEKSEMGEIEFLGWEKNTQTFKHLNNLTIQPSNLLTFYFQPKNRIADDYFFEITARDMNQKPLWQKIYPPAYGLLPTHDWPTDQYIQISQILLADSQIASYQISLIKIKGDIELGPLNDTQLVVDKKEKMGEFTLSH